MEEIWQNALEMGKETPQAHEAQAETKSRRTLGIFQHSTLLDFFPFFNFSKNNLSASAVLNSSTATLVTMPRLALVLKPLVFQLCFFREITYRLTA